LEVKTKKRMAIAIRFSLLAGASLCAEPGSEEAARLRLSPL
jgi:hypothetical protein